MRPRLKRGHPSSVRCTIAFAETGPFVAGDTEDTRKWVQVALAGKYLGYRGGTRPFEFTQATFDQMVKNIRSHASYRASAAGEGEVDIIPWDFEHQNDPDDPAVALEGLPAHGWTSDLKVIGAGDKAELWALTRLMEPALGYVVKKRYRQCSIDMAFEVSHPNTNEPLGPTLFAIALTNQPFIQGMEGLAASAYGYFNPATTPTEAFASLRNLFGLGALSSVAELVSVIEQVRSYSASGTSPLGVDIEDLVGCMRQILALPALTPVGTVLDNARSIVQRLLEEAGPQSAVASQENVMDPKKLAAIAALLGCSANETDIEASIADAAAITKKVRLIFKLKARDGVDTVIEALNDGATAMENLVALFKALGIEEADDAAERVASLIKSASDLEKLMPELKALREAQDKADAVTIEEEVKDAMASHGIPDSCLELMLSGRKSDPKKFAEKFPKLSAEEKAKRQKAAGAAGASGQGAQLTQQQRTALTTSVTTQGQQRSGAEANGREEGVVYLCDWPGANPTQQAIAYLEKKEPGFARLSHDQKHDRAYKLKRQKNVQLHAPS